MLYYAGSYNRFAFRRRRPSCKIADKSIEYHTQVSLRELEGPEGMVCHFRETIPRCVVLYQIVQPVFLQTQKTFLQNWNGTDLYGISRFSPNQNCPTPFASAVLYFVGSYNRFAFRRKRPSCKIANGQVFTESLDFLRIKCVQHLSPQLRA